MSAMLSARGLVYERGGRRLVDGVDLDLAAGKLTAVIGPNGAGKSTLLRLLGGEIKPSRGAIVLDGQPLASLPPWRLAHARAVMPQAAEVSLPFTALEIVRFGADGIGRGLTAAQRRAIARDALDRADVAHLAEKPYQVLSGGERQRVQFARALAQLRAGRTLAARQALLLDEPVSNLDLRHQLDLFETVTDLLADGVAVLAVLHDLQLAAGVAHDIALLDAGRLAASGTPAEVLSPDRLAAIFGVRPAGAGIPAFPWMRHPSPRRPGPISSPHGAASGSWTRSDA